MNWKVRSAASCAAPKR